VLFMESTIWTEKYRPKEFFDIKGQREIVKRAEAFVKQKNNASFIVFWPAGTGKTSLALVISKKLIW